MSEPLSSPEIEDVVSSIRRLVSPDRPKTRDLSHERLLLTPALRVVLDTGSAIPPPFAPPRAPAEPAAKVSVDSAPAPAAAPVVDEQSFAENWEATGGKPEMIEAEWGEKFWAEPGIPLAELAIEVEEAELIMAVPQSFVPAPSAKEVWPESIEEPAAWAQDWTEDVQPVKAPAKAAASVKAAVKAPAKKAPVKSGAAKAAPKAAEAKAPVARKTPVRRRTKPVVETEAPNPAPRKPVRSKTLAPRVKAPAKGVSAAVADLKKQSKAAQMPVEQGLRISEAQLQTMIRDLIRDELQGSLGEKITRNVRKLVRAEINRALAAREFD
jgi:hypothetical protein